MKNQLISKLLFLTISMSFNCFVLNGMERGKKRARTGLGEPSTISFDKIKENINDLSLFEKQNLLTYLKKNIEESKKFTTPKKKTSQTSDKSPSKMGINIENICRKALNANNKKDEIHIIPQILLINILSIMKKISSESFIKPFYKNEAEKVIFEKKLKLALCYMLFLAINQCNTKLSSQGFKNFSPNININDEKLVLSFLGYKFIAFPTSNEIKIQVIKNKTDEDTKRSFYNSDNFIKQTIIETISLKNKLNDKALSNNFSSIIEKLNSAFHDKYEKFFHTIIATLFVFMGSNLSGSEMHVGDGRSDLLFQSPYGNGIIEFKVNKYKKDKYDKNKDKEKIIEGMQQIVKNKYFNYFYNESNKSIKLISFVFNIEESENQNKEIQHKFTHISILTDKKSPNEINPIKVKQITDGYEGTF